MTKFLIGAAALALVSPAVAQVAPVAPQPGQRVHTRAEVQTTTAQMFARLDTNRDGFVTKAEADAARAQLRSQFAARSGEKRGAAFDRIDANRDGSVTRQEWDARTAQRQGDQGDDCSCRRWSSAVRDSRPAPETVLSRPTSF